MRSRVLGATLAATCFLGVATACTEGEDAGAGVTLAPIATTTTIPPTVPPTVPPQPRFYEIQPGDTLIEIAAAYGLPMQAIMERNAIVDQNKIFVGQILELPIAAEIVATSLPPTPVAPTVAPAITTAAP